MAIASRGLSNKSIDLPTKQLRALSCFGFNEIKPCPYLKKSKNSKFFYCGKCGCGDKSTTWLIKDKGDYAKLDYPTLNCPVYMPGFTNYDPNYVTPEIKDRREQIENFDPENLKLIQVTLNQNPLVEKTMDDLNKILKNS